MDGAGAGAAYTSRTAEEVFRDLRGRRAGMIRALTDGTRASSPSLPNRLQILACPSWIRLIKLLFRLLLLQMWTSFSSSATLVSAFDLFGFPVCLGDYGMQRFLVLSLFEFGCFSVRLETRVGEFRSSLCHVVLGVWNYWWLQILVLLGDWYWGL